MNNELNQYLFYDKPVPYKSILIYPVLMSDYLDFHMCVECLLLDKNSIPDPNIISLPYLGFLYYQSKQGMPYLYLLYLLLCLVLHINKDAEDAITFYEKDGKFFFSIYNVEFNSNDFDNIVKIIFKQNCIEPIDDSIQKEIRDAMIEAEEYKRKQNATKAGSLEDQIICVLISTSLKLEDIYKLTIRKFSKILQRVDYTLHYKIYLSAEMSGMVKFKDRECLKHWTSDLDKKDKFSDVKMDMDEMRNKIDSVNL